MGQYTVHVFVCTDGPWCGHDGDTDAIVNRLKRGVSEAGLKGHVRINRSGCLNQCGHGPMVVIYPEGRWYAGVQADDVPELLTEEIINGRPVPRLLYKAPPGDNKDLSRYPPDLVAATRAKGRDS